MKHKGIFTLQAKGNGEVHTLFSDITNDGFLRGYAGFETECLNCENDLLSLMGSGHISFTLDQGEFSKRYQGIVPLEGNNISNSAEHYFNNSEQLKTRFVTFNSYDFDKKQDEAYKLESKQLVKM